MTDALLPIGDGHTALTAHEHEHLIPTYIATRGDLNEAEQRNIASFRSIRFPMATGVIAELQPTSWHRRWGNHASAGVRISRPRPRICESSTSKRLAERTRATFPTSFCSRAPSNRYGLRARRRRGIPKPEPESPRRRQRRHPRLSTAGRSARCTRRSRARRTASY